MKDFVTREKTVNVLSAVKKLLLMTDQIILMIPVNLLHCCLGVLCTIYRSYGLIPTCFTLGTTKKTYHVWSGMN